MDISNELLVKAKQAKTVEELLQMAKAENIELTAEQAEKAYADLHKSGELSDEELNNVSGGCGDESSGDESKRTPKFSFGDCVKYMRGIPPYEEEIISTVMEVDDSGSMIYYKLLSGDKVPEKALERG